MENLNARYRQGKLSAPHAFRLSAHTKQILKERSDMMCKLLEES